jgi:8-hydroxy-5-deazaflavin:NADPH oxidoreductase
VLFGVFAARGSNASRPSLTYCGDNVAAKRTAETLIRDVGFDAIDVGPLRSARYTEPMAVLIAELAYGGSEGPELAYRLERIRNSE